MKILWLHFSLILILLANVKCTKTYAQEKNNGCTNPPWGQELTEPDSIAVGNNGEVNATLVVRIRERCVPVFENGTWVGKTFSLRTYGYSRGLLNNPGDRDLT